MDAAALRVLRGLARGHGHTNKVAERFDIELDRRADLIHRALHKLDRERMVQQVETMIGALRHGLIEPADFARPA